MKHPEGLAKDVNSLWITRKKHELWQLLGDREEVKGRSGEQPQIQKYLCSALPSQWHINFKPGLKFWFCVLHTEVKGVGWKLLQQQTTLKLAHTHVPKKIKKSYKYYTMAHLF